MRNVPFLIFYGMKISELKAPALVAKYREWVKAVGCRGGANFRHCSNT